VSTGTTLQLAGYRYSTRGFHTLDDTALKSMAGWTGDSEGAVDAAGRPVKRDWINYYNLNNNKRERLQVSLSQQLGNVGSPLPDREPPDILGRSGGHLFIAGGFQQFAGTGQLQHFICPYPLQRTTEGR
jgi:hypothetical protein